MMKAQDGGSIGNAIGLQSLLDEPTRLASEAERLNAELESLVMDNYKVFVENLTCSVHLKLEVTCCDRANTSKFYTILSSNVCFLLRHRTRNLPIYRLSWITTFMN